MDFKFSQEDESFRTEFRSWLEKNVPRDWRDDSELAAPDTKTEFERRRAWHRRLYDAGWMCIHWPKEYGGRGATLIQQFIYLCLFKTLNPDVLMMEPAEDWYRCDAPDLLDPAKIWSISIQ